MGGIRLKPNTSGLRSPQPADRNRCTSAGLEAQPLQRGNKHQPAINPAAQISLPLPDGLHFLPLASRLALVIHFRHLSARARPTRVQLVFVLVEIQISALRRCYADAKLRNIPNDSFRPVRLKLSGKKLDVRRRKNRKLALSRGRQRSINNCFCQVRSYNLIIYDLIYTTGSIDLN